MASTHHADDDDDDDDRDCDSHDDRCDSPLYHLASRNAGFLLIATAQFFFAAMNAIVALLTFPNDDGDEATPTWQLIFIRMFVTWLCCVSYMYFKRVEHPFLGPKDVRHLLVIRGVSGFWGIFGVYYSIQYLALSDATVLTFLAPVMAAALARPILGEPYSPSQAWAAFACMLGVVLVAKPSSLFASSVDVTRTDPLSNVTSGQRLGAVLVSVLGMLGAAGAYLAIRRIGHRASALHSISYYALWSTLVSLAYAIVTRSKPVIPQSSLLKFSVLVLTMGLCGFSAQTLLTMGVQRESISKGMMAVYLQVLFALINERILFGTLPDIWSWMGSVVIVAGAITVALQQPQKAEQESIADVSEEEELVGSQYKLLQHK